MSPSRHSAAYRQAVAIAAAILAYASAPSLVLAAEPGVVFRTAVPPSAAAPEVASVLEPAGGQFVYSNQSAAAAPRARIAIGKAPRTEYTFFSPDEQRELKALQDRLSSERITGELLPDGHPADAQASRAVSALVTHPIVRTAHATKRAHACAPAALTDQLASLAWPKVVQSGTQVCVPKVEFADKADWRDHVWCFDQGDGRVR